jgi:6-pyruvoyltetrahydropterin/6-carboxytetrahydropterin synthase
MTKNSTTTGAAHHGQTIPPKIYAERYHDISCGHRVVNHESKCRNLHGHNYRVHFKCEAPQLDSLGRVIDFSVIKSTVCMWLEDNWDHKMLIFCNDPLLIGLQELDPTGIVVVPFNPTAENLALYLIEIVGPDLLMPYEVTLTEVRIEETRKCSVSVTI